MSERTYCAEMTPIAEAGDGVVAVDRALCGIT